MKSLTKSNEDYLEAILLLEIRNIPIKSVKIAEMLGVSKPAVNKAMTELKLLNLINKDSYADITLTTLGRETAKQTYKKHVAIRDFLLSLGVDSETAEIDCCKIEHVISDKTLQCFIKATKK